MRKIKPTKRIKNVRIVTATAKCASFDIQISATITGRSLVADELEDVRRKLRHKLATSISVLPFAHVYPTEVTFS